MENYTISFPSSDVNINEVFQRVCEKQIVSHVSTHDGWRQQYTIQEHNVECLAMLMIKVGKELEAMQ